MAYHDQFAHTPDKRSGKGSSPSPAGGTEQNKKSTKISDFNQETDKTYGAGRFSQRTPETPQGGLSRGEHKNAHSEDQHGHGRDYNKGRDDQRYVSETPKE